MRVWHATEACVKLGDKVELIGLFLSIIRSIIFVLVYKLVSNVVTRHFSNFQGIIFQSNPLINKDFI